MTRPAPGRTRLRGATGGTLRAAVAAAAIAAVACGDPPPPDVSFDGARALQYVQRQIDFGPRIPGTDAHRAAGDWIVQTLRANADTVIEQVWSHVTATGDTLPMRNIFAQFNPSAAERILYVTHWDSRPVSDSDPDPARRTLPVPGANDGGSGTAMLLVLAEALEAQSPAVGVDLLFTDGEDYGQFSPREVDVLIGASYFAENPLPDSTYRPSLAILWDMIGDANLRFQQEPYSRQFAPDLVDEVWALAARMGYENVFFDYVRSPVLDDHVPLGNAGFRIIDVIDLEYTPHHTTHDTMDKISAASLEIVGKVALALIRTKE